MEDIDWKSPENSNIKRRPFTVNIEEDVARGFIKAVRSKGLYVRETMVKLMRSFSEYCLIETKNSVQEVSDESKSDA